MKPGIIRSFFIYRQIEKITKQETTIANELNCLLSVEDPSIITRCNELVGQLNTLEEKKKKLYFKFL